jgi:hypothetical protein
LKFARTNVLNWAGFRRNFVIASISGGGEEDELAGMRLEFEVAAKTLAQLLLSKQT